MTIRFFLHQPALSRRGRSPFDGQAYPETWGRRRRPDALTRTFPGLFPKGPLGNVRSVRSGVRPAQRPGPASRGASGASVVAPRGRPPQPLWIFSSPSVACRIFRRLASRLARSFPRTSPNGRSPGAPGAPGARLGRVRRASQNRRPSAPSERPASRATSSEVLRHVPDPPGTRPGPARSAPRGASGVSAGASKTARSLGAPPVGCRAAACTTVTPRPSRSPIHWHCNPGAVKPARSKRRGHAAAIVPSGLGPWRCRRGPLQ